MQKNDSSDYVRQYDSMTTNNSLREAKILLFHMPDSLQALLALSIKCSELQLMLHKESPAFHQETTFSPEALINELLPYASPYERNVYHDLLDKINQFMQLKDTMEFMQAMQEFSTASDIEGQNNSSNPFSGISPEDLINLFSQQ